MTGRGGCGCGTAFVVLLAIGVAELAAHWIGRHPLPAVLIAAAVVGLLVLAGRVWRDGQSRRPVVLEPAPYGWCPTCGERAMPGRPFCGRCGARVGPRMRA